MTHRVSPDEVWPGLIDTCLPRPVAVEVRTGRWGAVTPHREEVIRLTAFTALCIMHVRLTPLPEGKSVSLYIRDGGARPSGGNRKVRLSAHALFSSINLETNHAQNFWGDALDDCTLRCCPSGCCPASRLSAGSYADGGSLFAGRQHRRHRAGRCQPARAAPGYYRDRRQQAGRIRLHRRLCRGERTARRLHAPVRLSQHADRCGDDEELCPSTWSTT